jgi:hypothetical protein
LEFKIQKNNKSIKQFSDLDKTYYEKLKKKYNLKKMKYSIEDLNTYFKTLTITNENSKSLNILLENLFNLFIVGKFNLHFEKIKKISKKKIEGRKNKEEDLIMECNNPIIDAITEEQNLLQEVEENYELHLKNINTKNYKEQILDILNNYKEEIQEKSEIVNLSIYESKKSIEHLKKNLEKEIKNKQIDDNQLEQLLKVKDFFLKDGKLVKTKEITTFKDLK